MRRPLASLGALALVAVGITAAHAATAPAAPAATPATPASAPAPTDPLSAQLQQALAAQAQLEATKASLAGEVAASRDERSHLGELVLANQHSIGAFVGQIAEQQQVLADATVRAQAARERATQARARADEDRFLLGANLRLAYERDGTEIASVLSSGSASDFVSRLRQAQQLNSDVGGLVTRLAAEEADARSDETAAQAAEATARAAAAVLEEQKGALDAQVAHAHDLMSQLTGQEASALREINTAGSQSAALAQQIADLRIAELDRTIALAEQAAWDQAAFYLQHHLGGLPANVTAAPTAYYTAAGGSPPSLPAGGRLLWPAPGTVIAQGFGPSPYPFEPAAFGFPHFHAGIDLGGPTGTPIYAPAAGVVIAADPGTTGYGNHVIVALDAHSMCLFGHLEVMLVHPGDEVRAGQLIALMGSTGNSTGPHLHFEVRLDNTPVNPMPLLPPLPPGAAGPPRA